MNVVVLFRTISPPISNRILQYTQIRKRSKQFKTRLHRKKVRLHNFCLEMSSSCLFFLFTISSAQADTEEEQAAKDKPAEEEEEIPEPEDVNPITVFCCHSYSFAIILSKSQPVIREECRESSKCASLTKHFEHCQEKVHAGHGFKGEDCVEEMCVFLTFIDQLHSFFGLMGIYSRCKSPFISSKCLIRTPIPSVASPVRCIPGRLDLILTHFLSYSMMHCVDVGSLS
jgi:ubiquinol-cytochrome c reductase subunit 6